MQSSDVWLYPTPRVSDTTTFVWLDGKDKRVWLYRAYTALLSFMQFSTKIDGFEQKDSQGFAFENSYNSYEQYPLEKFFIFTIYQNYTLKFGLFFFFLLYKDIFYFKQEL